MIELWRGGVAVSECDGMGHMNVGYYGTKALQGTGRPGVRTGSEARRPRIREQNTRFLREARAGAALYLTGGFLSFDEGECVAFMRLRHISGEIAAGYRLKLAWPVAAASRAQALFSPAPEEVMPRGTPDVQPWWAAPAWRGRRRWAWSAPPSSRWRPPTATRPACSRRRDDGPHLPRLSPTCSAAARPERPDAKVAWAA
jgi:acyl-CoA thioesterase FadM